MNQNEFIKGTLSTILLQLLAEKGPMYGYEITREVRIRSGNKILLKEGSLYPALRKMLGEGVLHTYTETVDNRARVYYAVTQTGKVRASEQTSALLSFMQAVHELLNPEKLAGYA
jgi:DNA-binding PadR family transcriptional regulator